MARHLAQSDHALRVRTAIGGALTAGALLAAPVAVPLFTGVAQAQPAPSPSDQLGALRDALKGANTAHQGRVAAARTTIKNGVQAQDPEAVVGGLTTIRESKKTLRVQVQGILRGTLGGGEESE